MGLDAMWSMDLQLTAYLARYVRSPDQAVPQAMVRSYGNLGPIYQAMYLQAPSRLQKIVMPLFWIIDF